MIFLQFSTDYYLAIVRAIQNYSIYTQTSITSNQRCLHKELNIIIYHVNIKKIYGVFMCLCTQANHSNCFEFNRNTTFQCRQNDLCKNNGLCYHDDVICPRNTLCICFDCYFGTRCEFYAKGFGLTLDDILRYEI
ncbi:unnamed protein product [Adineta steineri]|uniref:EGF-like domain-containing protein n=1 Tax=Adineta steineri TaxID=433720 RepID=A0A814VCB8_9BILA|nr:unnamed protein product [Adineta steineri]CAF4064029.1 unnamed protein product [Adineta steineri]